MFFVGNKYGAFYCEIDDNEFHKNAACLIVLGKEANITVIDQTGTHHTGSTLMISPMVEHQIISPSAVWQIYLAPYSAYAVSLYEQSNESGITLLASDALPIHCDMSNDEIINILDAAMLASNINIDPRLAAVLDDLDTANNTQTSLLPEVAKRHDISPSRLRVIAKEQIGIPLSTLILWRKLVKSIGVLSSGATLSEAALAGGFSDQAHFTRTTRKMFGVTPRDTVHSFDYEK